MTWHATPTVKRKRRGGRTIALTFLLIAVLLVVSIVGVALYGRSQLEAPAADHSAAKVVTVHQGESLDDVVSQLDQAGLIKSKTWFSLFARFKGLGTIAPGDYSLDSGMGASSIISRLQSLPDISRTRVVLTEGMTAQQMAAKVAKANLGISADQYMAEVNGGSFSAPFLTGRPAGASLEGFLFPDTYEVAQGASAHDLVQMQLDAFAAKAAPLLKGSTDAGLNTYQTLTLASIVEREAQQPVDFGKVAGVLTNRLKDGMQLQVDATVSYGLGKPGTEPNADELKKDTPYNTYVHSGLPPTPISNPGVASIQAAVSPTSVPYIYYVSDGCGVNHYATTISEFEQIKNQYVGQPCSSSTGT
jgi:UPF0755 protein